MRPSLLVLPLIIAGCASPKKEQRAERRTLTVAYGADEFPLTGNRDRLGRYPVNTGICEPLVRLTSDFTVASALARSWESREPAGTVRFNIRNDVVFSDGTPLVARDGAYTLARAARTRADYAFLSDSSARVVDDTTLDVRPARVNRRLVEQLVHPVYDILEPGSDPTRRPVCTGPFRLASYTPHDRLTVVRNTRYRGPLARLDTVIFRFIPDETTRTLALRSGEVDVIVDVGRSNASALDRLPNLRTVISPPGAVLVMYMNVNGSAPYNQLRDSTLRRAVAMALDRRTLVQSVLGRGAALVNTVNPPSVLGAYASVVTGVPYEPRAAARVLNGRRRSLTLIANPGSVDRATVEYVQAQLARVGIAVAVEQLDAAAFGSRLNSGSFDLDLEEPSQNDANPAFLLALRWYSRSNTRSVTFTQASPRFDTLVERALAATTDDDARRAAAAAMHQLVDVEVGAIPLAGISRIYAMSDRVRGFVPHPSRLNQGWSTVWLAR